MYNRKIYAARFVYLLIWNWQTFLEIKKNENKYNVNDEPIFFCYVKYNFELNKCIIHSLYYGRLTLFVVFPMNFFFFCKIYSVLLLSSLLMGMYSWKYLCTSSANRICNGKITDRNIRTILLSFLEILPGSLSLKWLSLRQQKKQENFLLN